MQFRHAWHLLAGLWPAWRTGHELGLLRRSAPSAHPYAVPRGVFSLMLSGRIEGLPCRCTSSARSLTRGPQPRFALIARMTKVAIYVSFASYSICWGQAELVGVSSVLCLAGFTAVMGILYA